MSLQLEFSFLQSFGEKLNRDGLFPSERFTLKPHGGLSFVQV